MSDSYKRFLNSLIVERHKLQSRLGKQFNGKRNIYEVAGYPLVEPQWEDYYARYMRQDIATTIVDLPAIDTWRRRPQLIDDGETSTEFMKQFEKFQLKHQLWHSLERVDRLAGIGEYAVLLVGIADGRKLDEPASKSDRILYLTPYSQGNAEIMEWETNERSERYMLPKFYNLTTMSPETSAHTNEGVGKTVKVHHSRVIHVAENLLDNKVFGRPRLRSVYNRLLDLDKVIAGSSEATWQLMDRGMQVDISDGFEIDPEDLAELDEQLDEYYHGLRRILRTRGVDINPLGGMVVNPNGLFDIIISTIASSTKIPKRKLLGSELGQLASTQDENNWAAFVASRRTNFAEPIILRPLIDKAIELKILPAPKDGDYEIKWPTSFELTDLEHAQLAENKANVLAKIAKSGVIGSIVSARELREEFLRMPASIPDDVDEVVIAGEQGNENEDVESESPDTGDEQSESTDTN